MALFRNYSDLLAHDSPWTSRITAGILLSFLLPLSLYVFLGLFTRYIADDWGTASIVRSLGFWEAQRYWYTTWSGRFTFTFLVSLANLTGVASVPFTTVGGIILLGLGIYGLFYELSVRAGLARQGLSSMLGAVLVHFITLRSHGDVHQAFYWQTGILTYVAPLLAMIFMTIWLLRRTRLSPARPASLFEISAFFIIALLASAFSETSAAVELTLLCLALLYTLGSQSGSMQRLLLVLLVSGILGGVAGTTIMALSPGNFIRDARLFQDTDLITLLYHSFYNALQFVWRWIVGRKMFMAIDLVLPAIAAFYFKLWPVENPSKRRLSSQRLLAFLVLLPLSAFLLIWASFVPSFYVLGSQPPGRAKILPLFGLVFGTALWSYLAGYSLKLTRAAHQLESQPVRLVILGIIGVLLVAGPFFSSIYLAEFIPRVITYAQRWDQRDQALREAAKQGIGDVIVVRIRSPYRDLVPLGELRADTDFWINRAVASYYGLDTIEMVLPADPSNGTGK